MALPSTDQAPAAPSTAAGEEVRRWRLVVWAGAALFTLVFGFLILRRHATYGTFVFDLGIFDQGLWLLSQGQEPLLTLRGLHLFADHSSYLMVPLVPLYWLVPDVRVLLVLTVAVLALGAPALWAVARGEGLTPRLAAALAIGYLLHPATQWNTWDNFHPETLTVPLLIGAFALAQRRRFGWMLLLLILVLAAKEDAALIVVPFGLYVWWRWRQPATGLATAGLGVGVFLLNTLVLLPHFSPFGELIYTGRYAQFGEGLGGALMGMVTNPGQVVAELATVDRLGYVAAMLLPLALCLLAPDVLAIGIPITLANLLSIHPYQHEIKWHYTAYLLAVVAVAAAVGTRRLLGWRPDIPRGALAVAIVGVALAGSLAAGPWPGPAGDSWLGWAPEHAPVDRALAQLPEDAVVSADWASGSHLSHRARVYEFPAPFRPPLSVWAVPGVPLPPAEDVEYVVLLDSISRLDGVAPMVEELRENPDFETVVDDGSVLIFRRLD